YELLGPSQFRGEAVNPERISPRAQGLQQHAGPSWRANILHRWPTRAHHHFEIIDQLFGLASQPGSLGIDSQREIHPALGPPLLRRSGEAHRAVQIAVHRSARRHRGVVINDDFGMRIDSLDLPNEIERLSRVPLRIARIADDKGKFRNDSELAYALRHRH